MLEYAGQGTRRAFEELVRRYERELYGYLRGYLGDATLAEDAFQGTFLQVHLKAAQYDPTRAFRPWLYTIATNQAIDLLRSNRRHRALSLNAPVGGGGNDLFPLQDILAGDGTSPGDPLESDELRQAVQRAVDRLPKRLKQVLILVMYQGMKYRDAARSLGVPVGTVKSRVHTAIARLQKSVGGQNGSDGRARRDAFDYNGPAVVV